MSQVKPTILYEDEYCHVINNENGELEIIDGPTRFVLPPNKSVHGAPKRKKVVLKENEYVVVQNPFDKKKGSNNYGSKEVVVGPAVFAMFPNETFNGVQKAEILNKNQAAVVKVLADFDDKKAGQLYMVQGPTVFIPKKFEQLERKVEAITVSENEAVYIRDTLTAELKLVKGPVSYLLNVNEEKYYKKLAKDEYQALAIPEEASFKAFSVQIQKNECICVANAKTSTEEYILGPESKILGAHENIKVISISAGVPKQENAAKIATVNLGPDFMNDSFTVRTKDNAVLELELSYKWRFLVEKADLFKLFEGDFIGYACQSLRSRIREVAGSFEFEKFHTSASQLLRERLFKTYSNLKKQDDSTEDTKGRFFTEFNLLIFELDVKRIRPVDREIEALLDESIKSSMKILCRKLNDNAETEAEKEKIESESEISRLQGNLIEIQNANYSKETLEKAKIEGNALIETAKAEQEAELLLSRSRLDLELKAIKDQIELLGGPLGYKYIEFIKATNLGKNVGSVTVVPSDAKNLFLPANLAAHSSDF